jgi:ATP-dependent Clp protease adaptor protein ClpS
MATQIEFEVNEDTSLKYPQKYKVYLLNDDYTSMEFVIDILITIFHKSYEEAEKTMLEVHKNERALCGIYIHEIAETKVMQVSRLAKENGFPLKATMEEE